MSLVRGEVDLDVAQVTVDANGARGGLGTLERYDVALGGVGVDVNLEHAVRVLDGDALAVSRPILELDGVAVGGFESSSSALTV